MLRVILGVFLRAVGGGAGAPEVTTVLDVTGVLPLSPVTGGTEAAPVAVFSLSPVVLVTVLERLFLVR